jgi:hypothetical protein
LNFAAWRAKARLILDGRAFCAPSFAKVANAESPAPGGPVPGSTVNQALTDTMRQVLDRDIVKSGV